MKKKVIKVAPRPAISRKKYARFLTGLERYLKEAGKKVEKELEKHKEKEKLFLAE